MYRVEESRELKTLVVVLHGMQDGTEAYMMRIDLSRQVERLDETWSLIFDFGDFERAAPAAVKQLKLLAGVLAGASFRKRILIPSADPSLTVPFRAGAKYTVVEDFDSAWELVGGSARNVPVEPPDDGTRYPANTFPTSTAK
ncbi:MAG: hypothetical protein V2A56_12835 [bacterium]